MKFRRDACTALISAVVVVVAGMAFVSNRLVSDLTRSVEDSQFDLMQSIIDTNLRSAEQKALARAELIAALPAAQKAMAAQDRPRLLAEFADMFAGQKDRHGVDQAQFHLPPATSLLRLHSPDQFGDDLSRFRPLVVKVNRERASSTGIAIARSGPAIFGVSPVRDAAGTHLGSFEVGLEFGPLLDSLKAAYGLDLTLFVEEKPLREFGRGVNPAILSDQNRVGRFIRFHSTHAELMTALADDADISVVNEPIRYTREGRGTPYGVLLVPLKNKAGESLGVIAVARDFSGTREAAGRSLVWQICLAVLAVVLLTGAILVILRGFLIRPLDAINGRFAALADGDTTATVEDASDFCLELQELSQHHERLRAKMAAEPVR